MLNSPFLGVLFLSMNAGPKSAAAVQGFLQLAWVDEAGSGMGSVQMNHMLIKFHANLMLDESYVDNNA